jgi:hypothetical protein
MAAVAVGMGAGLIGEAVAVGIDAPARLPAEELDVAISVELGVDAPAIGVLGVGRPPAVTTTPRRIITPMPARSHQTRRVMAVRSLGSGGSR